MQFIPAVSDIPSAQALVIPPETDSNYAKQIAPGQVNKQATPFTNRYVSEPKDQGHGKGNNTFRNARAQRGEGLGVRHAKAMNNRFPSQGVDMTIPGKAAQQPSNPIFA